MQEPSIRTSRLAIAGGLVVAIAVASAGFFVGRNTSATVEPVSAPAPLPEPVAPPSPKIEVPRILNRADIIAFGNSAADALSSGSPLPTDVANAPGRRFEIVLPFGCDGPAPEGSSALLRWRYDSETKTLRVHAAQTRWSAGDWGMDDTDPARPSFSGFWVSRPWSSAERCPKALGHAAAVTVQPVTLPGQTLAIAEILPEQAQRRDRPYEVVQRVSSETFSATQGFRLRLAGRIERLANGQPVQCIQPAGIEQRPICLVAVSIDTVRIENPASRETLGTWSPPRLSRTAP